MTDAQQPPAAAAPTDPAQAQAPAAWKPEPRQWTWKDLFTAPMLAFKPKCMAIGAAVVILLGLWQQLFARIAVDLSGTAWWAAFAGFAAVALAVFGLGATLIATFMKADLLDDEFLSFGEAIGQYKSRIGGAIFVPLFLAVLAVAVHGLLIWFPMFVCSIPYVGSVAYGLLYPLAFGAAVFAILLTIAVVFSLFVFPAIIAIRRHGWFDNVVDTIEAVGTKPHVLAASIILSLLMVWVSYSVGRGAMNYLRDTSAQMHAWNDSQGIPEPARAEIRAQEISTRAILPNDPIANLIDPRRFERFAGSMIEERPFYRWGGGLILGFWQTVIWALLLGYCLNLLIGGGMLTYLLVREDDYWDDEDLEDLDKLAKELEEEAKRDEAQAPAPAAPEPPKA